MLLRCKLVDLFFFAALVPKNSTRARRSSKNLVEFRLPLHKGTAPMLVCCSKSMNPTRIYFVQLYIDVQIGGAVQFSVRDYENSVSRFRRYPPPRRIHSDRIWGMRTKKVNMIEVEKAINLILSWSRKSSSKLRQGFSTSVHIRIEYLQQKLLYDHELSKSEAGGCPPAVLLDHGDWEVQNGTKICSDSRNELARQCCDSNTLTKVGKEADWH
ncbi:hypothetical protein F5146DRAFT_1002389 [Armillaria mellea]|nr:hypothetical protein F5146DRAFT_1002389 [Armillaria mellea]